MTVSASECVAIWRIRCHCHQATAQQRGIRVLGFALTIFRAEAVVAGRDTPTEVRSPHIVCFVVCFAVCDYWGIARLGILVLTAAHSQAAWCLKCRHACLDCTSIRGCTPIQSVPRLHYCKHVGVQLLSPALSMPRVSLPKVAKRLHTQDRRLLAALPCILCSA